MRQFVQLWVCRYHSTGSFISLAISPVGYTSTFSPARAVGFLFIPPSPLPPQLPPLVWLLNSGEDVIWRFRIKCAICFKKNSNKKKGIRVIAPFIFCEEDGRVRKDHPAWLKIPKSPTVWYCCTLGNRLALGQLKIMSKLNGASTVQVCGCVEVWVLHLFVPNRKEKRIVLVYMRQSGSISTCDKASWWHGQTFRKQEWLEDISRRTDNYATAVEFTGSIGAAAYRERGEGEEGERARERGGGGGTNTSWWPWAGA